ncbi:SDR family NAD(P)-dependent oxidoreductase [Telmatobacter bradus]|uniref:SDR family NAD(P)-dependent oxidoreductase n=1 Tax=Telmatobacter bradus TaxID=474953 RepID=UPI003B42EFAF
MANLTDFKGKWALVTGASSGIGAEAARQLAAAGANLVLTARRVERLEALAAELRERGAEVRVVPADLLDPEAPAKLFASTQDLAIEILINNAGLGQCGAFHLSPEEQELAQVRVNCEATVRLTRLFVPSMVERRRGWILFLASTASFQPLPYFATYAASKVFDRYFALGLAEEVGRYGVKVTALCPGPTESEFFDVARAGIFKMRGVQTAEVVVRKALHGLAAGKRTILPSFDGRMIAFFVRFLPMSLITRMVEKGARPKA